MLEELYQEAILESARSTAYRGDLTDRKNALNVLVHNPLCGDQVRLWIESGSLDALEPCLKCPAHVPISEGSETGEPASAAAPSSCINCARFSGHGCSISQASASMLCAAVEGKSAEEAALLIEDFKKLLNGSADHASRERLGELVSLEGVRRFPARARCASIAFEALAAVLRKDSGAVVTTGC